MRNLKRALSLLLSSTMVLGMVVMGGSAAGYQDVDASNDNQEAIEVLQAVGIMSGVDDKGNFNPDGSLTRNEMAVVMAHLLNLDYDYYRGVNTFSDVPEWAAPYVAACVAEGVTAGIGNGLYGGDQKITAAQAGLMVMKALGYFQNQEDFGDDWQVATIRQASYINLFDKVNSNAETALTRGQVAQLVLNGLKSDMVSFTGDKGVQIGDVTVGYHAEYTSKTSSAVKYNSIVGGRTDIAAQGQYYIQLGEELYDGKLKLANGSDDFERPSRVWSYDGKEIGTYAKNELKIASYTKGVTGKEMYDLLSAATIKESELAVYLDGKDNSKNVDESKLVRSNNNDLNGTGNGVLTEVYLDTEAKEITIVSVNTYLAKATADYNESKEYAPLNVYVKDADGINYNVDVEEVAAVADVTEDSFYQVNISYKHDTTNGEVVAIAPAKVLEDSKVTKFSTSSNKVSKVTVDGTEYKANEKAYYDDEVLNEYNENLLTDMTYNVYVDANGYFLGVALYEGTKNYVFIAGYDLDGSHIAVKTATASAVFPDGTIKNIEVNVADTNDNIKAVTGDSTKAAGKGYFDQWISGDNAENNWYTYTVDDNQVYTLKPADRSTKTSAADNSVLRTDSLYVDSQGANTARVYGEDSTVFLTVDTDYVSLPSTADIGITDVTGRYTGVQSVELEIDAADAVAMKGNVFTVYDSNNYMIAAVVLGDAIGSNQNLAYILSGAKSEEYKDGVYYWEFDAIMDGQVQTFTAKSTYPNDKLKLTNNLYGVLELRFDGNYVVDLKTVDASDIYTYAQTTGNVKISDESVYFMKDLTAANNIVSLSGNTLYITNNQKDTGLAIGKDAKAVVIQKENGELKKTEFSSVASAINYLADANENVTGKQYAGDIFALLNSNTSAAWVVFNSDTELKTGAQSGGVVTPGVTVTIGANNALTVTSTDKILSEKDALNEIAAFLSSKGLVVGTPYLANGVWQIPTFYELGNGIQLPASTYTFDANNALNQKITVTVNGVAVTMNNGDKISDLSAYGKYLDEKGTLTTSDNTALKSGDVINLYGMVNLNGTPVYGKIGSKVELSGNWYIAKANPQPGDAGYKEVKTSNVTYTVADQTISDGFYKVQIDAENPQFYTAAAPHSYASLNGTGAGYLLSEDGGKTWSYVNGGALTTSSKDLMVKKSYVAVSYTASGNNWTIDNCAAYVAANGTLQVTYTVTGLQNGSSVTATFSGTGVSGSPADKFVATGTSMTRTFSITAGTTSISGLTIAIS